MSFPPATETPSANRIWLNPAPGFFPNYFDRGPILSFHRKLPGYAPTPLVTARTLARRLGVGQVWIKNESQRFGLPAYKLLGASWATYRALEERDGPFSPWQSVADLAGQLRARPRLTLVAATEGNHGRAVARIARWLGLPARILLPAYALPSRIERVRAEGAQVAIVHGDYDAAVLAARDLADASHLVISDTSWEGYERIPSWVVEGYATLFGEVDAQLQAEGSPAPDLVAVQMGVGALAAAVVAHYRRPGASTQVLGVEPEAAACILDSLFAEHRIQVNGPYDPRMGGLNCGTPSPLAWPVLSRGLAGSLAISTERALAAVAAIGEAGVETSPSGAAGIGGYLELRARAPGATGRTPWTWNESAVLLAIVTEGRVDPEAMPSPPEAPAGAPPLFGHPRGLTVLALTGMWEVFAIFGLRTILIYYLVKQLHFPQDKAVQTYALSSAACVLMGLFGGLAADRFLGARKAVILGALIMAAASFSLAWPLLLYLGLGLMAIGNGLFKSTMVTQVGALYDREDPRRDRAFVVYKVGCNLGALAAPLVCGAIGTMYGWNRAFAASGIGMLVSIAVFVGGQKYLAPDPPRAESPLPQPAHAATAVPLPWARITVIWFGSILFWTAYRQIESTVALWADRDVDRSLVLLGHRYLVPAAWFQSLNPFLIFAFAPVVAYLWARKDQRASTAGSLGKMTVGCLQLAGAFAVMGAAAHFGPRTAGVGAIWLLAAVILLTLGELYFDPVGQALFNRLAVKGLFTVYASFWFLASLAAYVASAWLGGVWSRVEPGIFFGGMAGIALLAALFMIGARVRLGPAAAPAPPL